MKAGIAAKIDVTKIDKAGLFRGEKGTYLDVTIWVDTKKQSQYGDHGMITQDVSKDEKAQGVQGAILGNVKVFWQDDQAASKPQAQPGADEFDDDIPF